MLHDDDAFVCNIRELQNSNIVLDTETLKILYKS